MLTGDAIQAFAGEPAGPPPLFRPPAPEPPNRASRWPVAGSGIRSSGGLSMQTEFR